MQKAKITVSGVSRSSEGTTRLETVNTGTFTEKNEYCYARYEETEASGMAGTATTVKWNSSQVSLIRHGTKRCGRSSQREGRMQEITGHRI